MLIHDYFRSPEYAALSPRAVKALIDLYTHFKGANNGDLCAAWKIMAPLGWTSKDQLAKALQELLDRGWIVITRMGDKRIARLYAVTWLGIDHCGGKLDVRPNPAPSMSWRRPAKIICLTRSTGQTAPPHGSIKSESEWLCPAPRVNRADFPQFIDPPHGTLLRSMPSGRQFEQDLERWGNRRRRCAMPCTFAPHRPRNRGRRARQDHRPMTTTTSTAYRRMSDGQLSYAARQLARARALLDQFTIRTAPARAFMEWEPKNSARFS
jgi:hypothetical protein